MAGEMSDRQDLADVAREAYAILRLYLPDESALDGSWVPPPVERVS